MDTHTQEDTAREKGRLRVEGKVTNGGGVPSDMVIFSSLVGVKTDKEINK